MRSAVCTLQSEIVTTYFEPLRRCVADVCIRSFRAAMRVLQDWDTIDKQLADLISDLQVRL